MSSQFHWVLECYNGLHDFMRPLSVAVSLWFHGSSWFPKSLGSLGLTNWVSQIALGPTRPCSVTMDPWFHEVSQYSNALLGSTVSQWPLGSVVPCHIQCHHGPLSSPGPCSVTIITESPRLEKIFEISSPTCDLTPPCNQDHGTQCHIQSSTIPRTVTHPPPCAA